MRLDQNAPLLRNQLVRTPEVVFGEVTYRPGGVCGPRIQPDFELLVLHAGACTVTLDGAVVPLTSRSVYLFRPGGRELFRFAAENESSHFWCAVAPSVVPDDLRSRLIHAPFVAPWTEVFDALYATVTKLGSSRNRADLIDRLGLCFLSEFLAASQEIDEQAEASAVRLFLNYIERHFGEHDCLEAAHRAARLSRNALIYKFRTEMRLTPARYLWRLRVERGVTMLKETGFTISEIAERCGFKDPFHFSKQVKRHFGLPPKSIRNRYWSGNREETTEGHSSEETAQKPNG